MRRVFLDTVGLIGLWDEDDQWHADAARAFELLNRQRVHTVTTTFVLLECGNAAARTPYRRAVDRLRAELSADGKLIKPTEADWRLAWEQYRNNNAGGAGIVDHVSFIVMRRLGITDTFTNDRHFLTAGFATLF